MIHFSWRNRTHEASSSGIILLLVFNSKCRMILFYVKAKAYIQQEGVPIFWHTLLLSSIKRMRKLFSVVLVWHGQLLAATGATGIQHATAVLCCHSLAETVLVHATTIVRLKCSFHLSILILTCYFWFKGHNNTRLGCKITHKFRNNKELSAFSTPFLRFFIKL